MSRQVDILANRKSQKWSKRELLGRLLWEAIRVPLFYWTPRQAWAWRRVVLRMFGATVEANVHIHPTAIISIPWNLQIGEAAAVGDRVRIYNLGLVSIGSRTTVSQQAHLCAGTHDYQSLEMPLIKSTISVGADAWICADAFVGPGVSVGDFAIVGARGVVMQDVAESAIVVGNPAQKVGDRPPLR